MRDRPEVALPVSIPARHGEIVSIEMEDDGLLAGELDRHLRTLPGVRVQRSSSLLPTDDVWVEGDYLGFPFRVEAPFADLRLEAGDPCPARVRETLAHHLRAYRRPGTQQGLVGFLLRLLLPRRLSTGTAGPV